MARLIATILALAAVVPAGCTPQRDPGWFVDTWPGGDPDKVMQCSTNPYSWGAAPPTCGGPAGRHH